MNDILRVFDLSGRSAVVTGAAGGIGRATAILLAAAGASVALGDIDEVGMRDTAEQIERSGGRVVSLRTDVSRRAEVEALVGAAVSASGRLDIMANIAGVSHDSLVVETEDEDLDRILAINLKGTFYGCRAAMRLMVPQRSGNIINLASGVIHTPAARYSCYAMAKAGVAMLTRALAAEAAPYGIRVNDLAPIFIATNLSRHYWVDADGREDLEQMQKLRAARLAQVPLGMEGQPEDVAYAILYLVSDAARYVTGQLLNVNGGVQMPW